MRLSLKNINHPDEKDNERERETAFVGTLGLGLDLHGCLRFLLLINNLCLANKVIRPREQEPHAVSAPHNPASAAPGAGLGPRQDHRDCRTFRENRPGQSEPDVSGSLCVNRKDTQPLPLKG